MDIGFKYAAYLWLSTLLVVALSILLVMARNRKIARLNIVGIKGVSVPKTSFVWSIIIVSAMTLACLHPYSGFEDISVAGSGRNIVVLFDLSRSMLAKDVTPTRFEFAKRKLRDLIRLLEASGDADRMGIVLFASQSYLYCPLTSDYGSLNTFVQALDPKLMSRGGTRLDKAISEALTTAEQSKLATPILLLLSDGEDLTMQAQTLGEMLRQKKTALYSIGIGTVEGSPIWLNDGVLLKDQHGSIVVSHLAEGTLRTLSVSSGGRYFKASLDDTDLTNVLNSTIGGATKNQPRIVRVYRELGPWLVAAVAAIVTFGMIMGYRGILFASLIFLVLVNPKPLSAEDKLLTDEAKSASSNSASSVQPLSLHEAYKAYQRGDYEASLSGFIAHNLNDPADRDTLQGLASSYYKLGKFQEASRYFEELSKSAKSGRELFDAQYNLGNSRLMLGEFEEAIKAYDEALKLKKDDKAATANRDLAIRLKLNPPTPTPTPTPSPKDNQNQCSSPSSSSSSEASSQQSSSQSQSASNSSSSRASSSSEGSSKSSSANSSGQEASSSQSSASSSTSHSASEASSSSKPTQPLDQVGQSQASSTSSVSNEAAKAWLDSMPEFPILISPKQERGDTSDNEQLW